MNSTEEIGVNITEIQHPKGKTKQNKSFPKTKLSPRVEKYILETKIL